MNFQPKPNAVEDINGHTNQTNSSTETSPAKPQALTKEELTALFNPGLPSPPPLELPLELDLTAPPKQPNFLYKQWVIFSTPKLIAYFQGITGDNLTLSRPMIQTAKLRTVGSLATLTPEQEVALSKARAQLAELVYRSILFTKEGAAKQLTLVTGLLEAGFAVDSALTLDKKVYIETLTAYAAAQASYLDDLGYSNAFDYLQATAPKTKAALSLESLPNLEDLDF